MDFYGDFHVWIYLAISVGISMDGYLCGFTWGLFYVVTCKILCVDFDGKFYAWIYMDDLYVALTVTSYVLV